MMCETWSSLLTELRLWGICALQIIGYVYLFILTACALIGGMALMGWVLVLCYRALGLPE